MVHTEFVGMYTKELSPCKMSCACVKWYSIIYSKLKSTGDVTHIFHSNIVLANITHKN
jgi:hypothetical protein